MTHEHAANTEDPRSFQNEFMQILNTLANPMFHEFVSDALGNSFPADSRYGTDEAGNPYAAVRFILDHNARLDADRRNECELTFTGLLQDELIDIRAAYDQRPGKEAAYHEKLEIQMINQVGLEDQLTDFLAAAMAARRGQPIPPRKRDQKTESRYEELMNMPAPTQPQAIPIVWTKRKK